MYISRYYNRDDNIICHKKYAGWYKHTLSLARRFLNGIDAQSLEKRKSKKSSTNYYIFGAAVLNKILEFLTQFCQIVHDFLLKILSEYIQFLVGSSEKYFLNNDILQTIII